MKHKKISVYLSILLFCTGCDAALSTPSVSLPAFVTATLPVTAASAPTATVLPPTIAPTISPIAGTTTSEINVRADTSTASQSLGTIPAFNPVQVIGKDASGIWYQILFNNGTGWVRADFVLLSDATAEIPVIVGEAETGSAGRGVVLRGVNVRSGPGQDFDSLGLLNQNDVVSILGKDFSGTWIKIKYPPAEDGAGWVAAEYLQVTNLDAIPQSDEAVERTPTKIIETPLAQSSPPPLQQSTLTDNDTINAPLAVFVLSANGVRSVQFQGQVAALADGEDWFRFSAENDDVVIQVLCDSGGIKVELFQEGAANDLKLECGTSQIFPVGQGQEYLLRISPIPIDTNVSIKYELKIKISK